MENKTIIEFVKFEILQEVTPEQLEAKADLVNAFLSKQDGFIDCELVKSVENNCCYLVYHIENKEKLRMVGEKVRALKLFDEFNPIIVPGSMGFSFFSRLKKW